MNPSTLKTVRIETALDSKVWGKRLLKPEDLAKYANDMDLGHFTPSDIIGLWKIGLLRADLILSDEPIADLGLKELENISGEYKHAYCDFRHIKNRREGYGSSFKDTTENPLPESSTLAF